MHLECKKRKYGLVHAMKAYGGNWGVNSLLTCALDGGEVSGSFLATSREEASGS
jgi:hypothetical protein